MATIHTAPTANTLRVQAAERQAARWARANVARLAGLARTGQLAGVLERGARMVPITVPGRIA